VEAERHATAAEKKRLAELAYERDVLNKLRTQVGVMLVPACYQLECCTAGRERGPFASAIHTWTSVAFCCEACTNAQSLL
jgi:hypothetical protein